MNKQRLLELADAIENDRKMSQAAISKKSVVCQNVSIDSFIGSCDRTLTIHLTDKNEIQFMIHGLTITIDNYNSNKIAQFFLGKLES